MIRFIKTFAILTILYHIIVTIIIYGMGLSQYAELPALLRDGLWIIGFGVAILSNLKTIKSYIKKWKYPWIIFCILIGYGIIISLVNDKGLFDIILGIKFGFFYIFIFLSATFIGFAYKDKLSKITNIHFSSIIKYLIYIAIFGFLWQGAKMIVPEIFMNIGYGPLNDFVFGKNPPIYYLTQLGGTTRRQGIFAGPNNYGYFLVAFCALIVGYLSKPINIIKNQKNLNLIAIIIWILAIGVTLSRTAIIGGFVSIMIVNKNWLMKNKKILFASIGLVILSIIGLSYLKGVSTFNHIINKFGALKYVLDQPLGMGLGASGPAIHYNNSKILPENYFVQVMIDIGTIGFIIWSFLWLHILVIEKNIKKYFETQGVTEDEKQQLQIWKYINIGRISLLIMGIFLHVFEDSMVNYLFFGFYGLMTGYLSTKYEYKKYNITNILKK